jgi:hypothetical protein
MRIRILLAATAAVLVLAACQESESSSPSPSPSEPTFPLPSGMSPLPSFVGDQDLEDTLPDEAVGISFFKISMSGPDFVAGDVGPQFIEFLDRLEADIEDVSVGLAIGSNADGTQTASVLAFRVLGADAPSLIDEFKSSADAGGDPLVWHTESLGGKSVEVSDPNDDFPTPVVLYATGDVLYFASSTDPAALEEIVRQLP